jgi:ubiquinone/menaquinone biosynthesis C-methylase UbiE
MERDPRPRGPRRKTLPEAAMSSSDEGFARFSYRTHADHCTRLATEDEQKNLAETWTRQDTLDYWRHRRMYATLLPLLCTPGPSTWLTVGDGRFGTDARFIKEASQGQATAVASNLEVTLLAEAKRRGLIDEFRQENAERLSCADRSFDYVLCKESFHHFPRPMVALYEMLRVARRAVVIIEPLDPVWFPASFRRTLREKVALLWRRVRRDPAFLYEVVGNYVYSVSERELEKVGLGLNLPALATRQLNDCYLPGVEFAPLDPSSPLSRKLRRRIAFRDLLSGLGLAPSALLIGMLFLSAPPRELTNALHRAGFVVRDLPRNPYADGAPEARGQEVAR